MSDRRTAPDRGVVRFAQSVANRIHDVVGALRTVEADAPDPKTDSATDFGYFVVATRRMLEQRGGNDVLAGAGYAACYAGTDGVPAMVWWVNGGETVTERSHSVDPDSESFYDYAALRWFKLALESRRPTLSGPFIDTWGSDDYTVTVSLPVVGTDAIARGVLAADVDVRRFIDSLTNDLRSIETPVALVNEVDRVVVSTVPVLSTGLPLRPRGGHGDFDAHPGIRTPVAGYGWSVVDLSD
jgi:hypothetical protein